MSAQVLANDGTIAGTTQAGRSIEPRVFNSGSWEAPKSAFVWVDSLAAAGLTATPPGTPLDQANPLVLNDAGGSGGGWVRWHKTDRPPSDEAYPAPLGLVIEFDDAQMFPQAGAGGSATPSPAAHLDGSVMSNVPPAPTPGISQNVDPALTTASGGATKLRSGSCHDTFAG